MTSWTYTLGEIADAIGAAASVPGVVVRGVSTDTRKLLPGNLFFALTGPNFDANALIAEAYAKGASAVVTTREDVSGPAIVTESPLAALQRMAAWHRAKFDIPILAITGSVGKTTTKEFVAAVLATCYDVVKTRGNLNNDIGCPLSLLEIQPDTGFAVIEMGANHQGEIAAMCNWARPTESVITRIGETHVEGFGGLDGVEQAKGEIAEGLRGEGVFYVNTDDPRCVRAAERHHGEKAYFGSHGAVRLETCSPHPDGGMILDIPPVGRMHLPLSVPAQATSVLIAVAVGLRHGVTSFEEPLQHACANAVRFKKRVLGPLTVMDDSYNASPPSMRAALEALALHQGGRRFAALGDMFELGADAERLHRALGAAAGEFGVDTVFALGEHAERVAQAAREAGVAEAVSCKTHAEMAAAVLERANPGDALLVKGSRGMKMETVIQEMEVLLNQP